MSEPQGWTPVQETSGWTPVDEPNFSATNEKDAQGNAVVRDAISGLLDFLPAAGGTLGGMVGGAGGTAFGLGFGGIPGAVGGATLGGSAGEALRQLVERVRGKETPATATDAASSIGAQGAINGGTELAGGLAMKGLGAGAKAVYRGYLKPSLAKAAVGKADQIVETALQEALPVTKAGSRRANQVIKELRAQVDGILQQSGADVDLHTVAEKVRAFAKSKYLKPGRPTEDFDAAMKVADSLDAHPSLGLPPGAKPTRVSVSATDANAVKRGLDQTVGESNFGVDRGATKTTQKIARYQLRKSLEGVAPEIAPLNARESKLIDAAKAIEKAVAREGNQNVLNGVKTLASGAVGAEEYRRGKSPYEAAATALAIRAGLTPAVASRAAIVAFRLGKMSGALPATAARVAVTLALRPESEPPAGQP